MKTQLIAAMFAAALAAAFAGASLAGSNDVTAKASTRTVLRLTACAKGFSKAGQYPGGTKIDYECRTPVIKCPPKADYLVGIEPAPPMQNSSGLRLRYHCTYEKKPG